MGYCRSRWKKLGLRPESKSYLRIDGVNEQSELTWYGERDGTGRNGDFISVGGGSWAVGFS